MLGCQVLLPRAIVHFSRVNTTETIGTFLLSIEESYDLKSNISGLLYICQCLILTNKAQESMPHRILVPCSKCCPVTCWQGGHQRNPAIKGADALAPWKVPRGIRIIANFSYPRRNHLSHLSTYTHGLPIVTKEQRSLSKSRQPFS